MIDLTQLNVDDVQRNLAIHKQIIKELHPTIDVERGVFHDLVLYYSSIFATINQHNVQRAIAALNTGKVAEYADILDDAHVNRIGDNWQLKRKAGNRSKGAVTIRLMNPLEFIIPNKCQFVSNNITFRTNEAYMARNEPDVSRLQDNERQLVHTVYGWEITIPVTAVDIGKSTNLRKGARLTCEVLSKYSPTIHAAVNFTGGEDQETNSQLLQRLPGHISNNSNKSHLERSITDKLSNENWAGITIVGFGDACMHRDKCSAWPGSVGGKCDIYLKSPNIEVLTVKPSTIKTDGVTATLQLLPNDDYVIYDVLSVSSAESNIFTTTIKQSSCKPSYIHSNSANDVKYSAYQTIELDLQLNQHAENHSVQIVTIPGIPAAQAIFEDKANRTITGDVLVKAAMPLFVKSTITVKAMSKYQKIDTESIKQYIASTVCNLGFISRVDYRKLVYQCLGELGINLIVTGIELSANLPDNTQKNCVENNDIVVPNDPDNYLTSDTVGIYQRPEHIEIVVTK